MAILARDSACPGESGSTLRQASSLLRHGSRKLMIGAASATLAASAVIAAAPGAAQAAVSAPQTAGKYCGTYDSGTTDGSVWYKKPPGCHDLNLVSVNARPAGYGSDNYIGIYFVGGRAVYGANGWHYEVNGSTGDVVLLSNVATGTEMQIGSLLGPGLDVVGINY
jgi:hypothetical protein